MIKIYSRIDPDLLLHIIVETEDFIPGRNDIVKPDQFIQAALLNMPHGSTFKPHKHIWKEGQQRVIAQEAWICIKGAVRCSLYDTDNKLLSQPIITPMMMSITLLGGHTYEMLEDSLVIEMKTGPYDGKLADKMFI